jgi:hypothetical protein
MSTLIEKQNWFVQRPGPDSDICAQIVSEEDGSAHWVRVVGLGLPADYLSAAEARELAGVLVAAADELSPPV